MEEGGHLPCKALELAFVARRALQNAPSRCLGGACLLHSLIGGANWCPLLIHSVGYVRKICTVKLVFNCFWGQVCREVAKEASIVDVNARQQALNLSIITQIQ